MKLQRNRGLVAHATIPRFHFVASRLRRYGGKISLMDKTFTINGMHNSGCVTRITRSLSGFAWTAAPQPLW